MLGRVIGDDDDVYYFDREGDPTCGRTASKYFIARLVGLSSSSDLLKVIGGSSGTMLSDRYPAGYRPISSRH